MLFTKIETDFSAEISNSNVFSAQNQVVSKKKNKKKRSSPNLRLSFGRNLKFKRFFRSKKKKKRSSPKLRQIFRPNLEIQTFQGELFFYGGGVFSIFRKKSTSKPPKTCDFAYFTSQWRGSSPPAPPGYATGCNTVLIKWYMKF